MLFKKLLGSSKVNQHSGNAAPPGQYVTEKFPVMSFGPAPNVDLATWQFDIFGLVESEVSLNWQDFTALPKVIVDAEFHCVTQWSRLQNTWEGVAFSEVAKLVSLENQAVSYTHLTLPTILLV